MDYEEFNKGCFEEAKRLYKTANADQRYVLECLFPELAELRDERILEIIKHCIESRYLHTSTIKGISQKECFAWLEKQSNTIPDECVFRPVAGCDIESAAKQAIKQQGVLAKKIVLAFNGAYIPVGGKAADIIVNEYNSWLEKQGEQKSQRMVSAEAKEALYDKAAWSEEDDVRLQACLDTLQAKSLMGVVDTNMTKWLKSLKQRIGG